MMPLSTLIPGGVNNHRQVLINHIIDCSFKQARAVVSAEVVALTEVDDHGFAPVPGLFLDEHYRVQHKSRPADWWIAHISYKDKFSPRGHSRENRHRGPVSSGNSRHIGPMLSAGFTVLNHEFSVGQALVYCLTRILNSIVEPGGGLTFGL